MPPCSLLLCLLACAACVDQPNPVPPPGGTTPVTRLSELGLFEGSLASLEPAAGVVAYDVNVTLYADNAQKRRFVDVPPGLTIHATADRWQPPSGTYFIKNFYFPLDARDPDGGVQLLETRILIQQDAGLDATTYLWNADQTDALASGGNLDIPVRWIDADGTYHAQSYHVPGLSLCQSCHGDRALGWRTRQLDQLGVFGDGTTDQMSHLVMAKVADAPPPDGGLVLSDPFGSASLDARARSYLDVNCADCHAADGLASGTNLFWDYEDTDSAHLPICRATESVAGDDRILVPGSPDQSEFLARMLSDDPFVRMPQGPSRLPDGEGIAVLSQWVAFMTPPGCP